MIWKNLKLNPPMEDCSVCLKREEDGIRHYCLARYNSADNTIYDLCPPTGIARFKVDEFSEKETYINLSEIING